MKILLEFLFAGQSLSEEQAYLALKDIASGNQNDVQIAAFLAVYNMRFPTVEELAGFRKAMLDLAIPIKLKHKNTIDIVGTGGDGKNTFNISTAASFVCAGAGIKVTKSGNYGFTSVSGASNIFEYLQIPFATSSQKIEEQLDRSNISFLHAPLFHPAIKNVAHVRKELQVKSIFNLLGPLVNACQPTNMLIGVHSEAAGKLYKEVLKKTSTKFVIVHAVDGYDEISLTGDTRIFGRKSAQLFTPIGLGFKQLKPQDLLGGNSVKENADILLAILKGKGTDAQNNVVLANAALAISIYEDNSYPAALSMAKQSLFEGKALSSLNALKTI
ncbi:MAG TPA: anthranilate phosphoribosyltransferase [Chitinophagales bacterium]|mgnify:CR=1 FL=1|nr:anthranilate phosphoribosyltransferase [Chitinophagales bacterium]